MRCSTSEHDRAFGAFEHDRAFGASEYDLAFGGAPLVNNDYTA